MVEFGVMNECRLNHYDFFSFITITQRNVVLLYPIVRIV